MVLRAHKKGTCMSQELAKRLAETILEISKLRKELSPHQLGGILKDLGEAIQEGTVPFVANGEIGAISCNPNSLDYVPCSNPKVNRSSPSDIVCNCC